MELTFQTAGLREICEKRTVAAAELGYSAARELAERLADIDAADNVAELCELLGEVICDRSLTEKCLRIGSGFDIIFTSGHPAASGANLGTTNWKKISRMKITAIEPVNG